MKRLVVVAVVVAVAAGLSGSASASPPPSASCAAIPTSFEATQLPPGFVGSEVSGLAGRGFGEVIRNLARNHLGSLEECAGIAP
jgi:hypothetical protein